MTALHPTHAAAAETRTVAAVTRVANGLRGFFRAWKNRRHVGNLGNLSDHELADIGLTRTDLVIALRAPLGSDPTARLSVIARERFTPEDGARRVC